MARSPSLWGGTTIPSGPSAASPTDAQLDTDVALLRQGRANFVMGAHYPHDPRMMDRLDEAGILCQRRWDRE